MNMFKAITQDQQSHVRFAHIFFDDISKKQLIVNLNNSNSLPSNNFIEQYSVISDGNSREYVIRMDDSREGELRESVFVPGPVVKSIDKGPSLDIIPNGTFTMPSSAYYARIVNGNTVHFFKDKAKLPGMMGVQWV